MRSSCLACARPPSRRTASCSARPMSKRFTSSSGGLWFMTSCVQKGRPCPPRLVAECTQGRIRQIDGQRLIHDARRCTATTASSRCVDITAASCEVGLAASAFCVGTGFNDPKAPTTPARLSAPAPAASCDGAVRSADQFACSTSPTPSRTRIAAALKSATSLRGRTLINLFFEASTRTQSSFELAGKRLGADVMNMSVGDVLGARRARR